MDADLTADEAAQVLDPPLTAEQIRWLAKALRWKPSGHRHTGRAGHPHPTYPAAKIMSLHRALVDSGSIELFFGRATHPRRTPVSDITAAELRTQLAELFATWQAQLAERRALRDSMATDANRAYQDGYAGAVDDCMHALRPFLATPEPSEPSEEDKIRDAMTEATEHPGRMVTR